MSSTTSSPRVRLRQGTYIGRHIPATRYQPKALEVFLGIPYAQSTAGANRFRPAQPLDIAGSTKDGDAIPAVELGPISPFTDATAEPLPSSEDCLSVNVTRPALPEGDALLPVMVYIHGGAFNMGFGGDRDLASFVAFAKRDVVVVSFNYRLGVLGFLAVEDGEGAKEGLNLGLGDQRVAMEWVRENIGAFGGDGGNVTLMGISAGGHSVGHHILSYTPQAAPFHKAILESGSPTSRAIWYPSHPRQKTQLQDFLSALGLSPTEPNPLAALRSLPLEELTAAASKTWQKYESSVRWPFQPVIDDSTFIPDRPLELWRKGAGVRIPVITGFCTHEGTAFVSPCHSSEEFRAFFTTLIPGLTEADLDRLEELYPGPPPSSTSEETLTTQHHYAAPPPSPALGPHWRRLEAAYAHYAYIAPVLYTAHQLSISSPSSPVYVYEFAASSPPLATANHTDETPFVTHSLKELEPHAGLVHVSERMHGFFADFVAGGGDGVLEGWPAFTSPWAAEEEGGKGGDVGKIMVFGKGNDERVAGERGGVGRKGVPCDVRSLSEREIEQIGFWWERTALSQGFGERE
ncbi:hypothetical protein SAPIO_CDS6046 [Scedosporium apiospermum]|uniref:Carboxylic ester hydrolase n=1 Tax=Pseudallescheria apiosperma TaxID=563466 RepID=A0A084G5Z7_PSEDA|nr:uncharacterized protein SAPIO_CDS6046 [Scedosporium apiospermum]KEZ42759.1 hypothetical protein SAPIO_CDS6046 [Scedosporium apiospermum]